MRISLLRFFFVSSLLFITAHSYSDLDVLLSLKFSMVGHNYSVAFQDWTETGASPFSHCSFNGVTCDDSFKVVALNLSFSGLNSSIPPEIGQLVNLVNLTIAGSNVTGQLPLEMAKLVSLRLLNLSNNAIEGNFPGEITLGMTQLEVLDVYNNNFEGSLPRELVKLKKLRHLHLGGNYFSGSIPESYSEIESLEYLGLNGNALSGRVPPSLSKLKKLKEMYVGYYNSYEGGIPQEYGSLDSLQLLDMANCNIAGEIPSSLGQLKHLHTLFLQANKLTGNIPAELSGLVSLKSLDLSINELTGEIPGNFSQLQNLTLLSLFKNKLGGQIPDPIGDLPNLEALQVWENNFTFGLPQNLGRNGRLIFLDVSFNHLTGLVPPNLCKGVELKRLILLNNFFVGPLPAELGQCKSLERIRVANNMLSGAIPAGIFNLPEVTVVELDNNLFSGELPGDISGDALSLDWFTISNNRIEGPIPPALGNLSNLQTLRLDNNRISGELPEEVFNLRQLSKVNFSANNISGEFPPSFTHCISLTVVDLSQNSLSGELPQQMSTLKVLSFLNASRNQLTGHIPADIRLMTSLTTLDLSYNNLVGKIPTGGQFYAFKDSAFIGNPRLCTPHRAYCPPTDDSGHGFGKGHMGPLSASKLIITIIVLVTVLSLIFVTFCIIRKKRLQKSMAWKLTAFQRLDFKAEDVLECLKDENIIGKGGSGIVYRGSMPDGVDVAIKRLVGRGSGRSDHGFTAEIQTLGRIRHRNIVRLLGYVSNKDTNLLLYEYMPNGSLGEMLHGSKGGHLHWEARYRIAVEAAKGLSYLHHDCSPLIIHRDVKSNNILLDLDFEAHVADFGLAKFLQDPGASECMSSVAGSYGYIAPEYAYTLKVDEKSDVYSFGVVLLELIAGRKPVGEFGDGVDIVRWVRKTTSELSQSSDAASVLAVVDPRLSSYPLTGVIYLFKIAMMCVEDESSARPTMREVVHMLTNPPHSAPSLLSLD